VRAPKHTPVLFVGAVTHTFPLSCLVYQLRSLLFGVLKNAILFEVYCVVHGIVATVLFFHYCPVYRFLVSR
jgi:hypothetical protein